MKFPPTINKTGKWLLGLTALSASACAELLVHDSFDYPPGSLTGNSGGIGWAGPWEDSGNPVAVIATTGSYTDLIGNELHTSGNAINTTGTGTTISSRLTGQFDRECWISMVVVPQTNAGDFVGVSFYQDGLSLGNARFAIEHSENKNLRFTRRTGGAPTHSTSYSTTLGEPVLVVLHLLPGGGSEGGFADRIDVYFEPELSSMPFFPNLSMEIDGVNFDRIRIAGQNGRAAIVDEIRIGETYADVVPHLPADDPDSDGDGLTDSQEAILGTDPYLSDADLFAAILANRSWFGIHGTDEITKVHVNGPKIIDIESGQINYAVDLDVWSSSSSWFTLDRILRKLQIGSDPEFIRVALPRP